MHASDKLLTAVPAVSTVTGIVPAPATSVALAAMETVAGAATGPPSGQLTTEVNGGSAAPAGVAV